MKITWLAQAAFLIEEDVLRILTDVCNPQLNCLQSAFRPAPSGAWTLRRRRCSALS